MINLKDYRNYSGIVHLISPPFRYFVHEDGSMCSPKCLESPKHVAGSMQAIPCNIAFVKDVYSHDIIAFQVSEDTSRYISLLKKMKKNPYRTTLSLRHSYVKNKPVTILGKTSEIHSAPGQLGTTEHSEYINKYFFSTYNKVCSW